MRQLLALGLLFYLADASSSIPSVTPVTSYPPGQSSRISALSTNCVDYIKSCPLTESKCASQICSICTNLGISPPIEQCCYAPTPTNCFESDYIHGVTSTAASTRPLSIDSALGSGSIACKSMFSIYYSCSAATPGFQNLYWSDLQSCLCTTSGTFAPDYYDGYFSSCLNFVSKYDPSEYSKLGPIGGGSFSGTFTGIAISHGLGSKPCHAYYEYTQTTTPRPISSHSSVPPPQTSTSSQGAQAVALHDGVKLRTIIVVVVTNLYLVLRA